MLTLKIIHPAKNHSGDVVPSYSRAGIKEAVKRETKTFNTRDEMMRYISKNPGPAYELPRNRKAKNINA